MAIELQNQFRTAMLATLRDESFAEPLRAAAQAGRLMPWTTALTAAAVETCGHLGWRASAKGHQSELLPVSRGEYLALDVMAFAPGENRWQFPLAVMELENQRREDFIAYSLWKLLISDGKETQPTCMGIGVGGDLSVRMLL